MKKMYKQPVVEQTQMLPCSMVMAGSGDPGIQINYDTPGENLDSD